MLHETKHVRFVKDQSALILDDILCEHVGSLFEYIDHHYNHGDGNYPLAHIPVTSPFGNIIIWLDTEKSRGICHSIINLPGL